MNGHICGCQNGLKVQARFLVAHLAGVTSLLVIVTVNKASLLQPPPLPPSPRAVSPVLALFEEKQGQWKTYGPLCSVAKPVVCVGISGTGLCRTEDVR